MINYSKCSVRFIHTLWCYLGDNPEEIEPAVLYAFFVALFAGQVHNAGRKTAIEAAVLFCGGNVIDAWELMHGAIKKYHSNLHWEDWTETRLFNQIITEAMRFV